jgi:hypothetical protein
MSHPFAWALRSEFDKAEKAWRLDRARFEKKIKSLQEQLAA